MENLFTEGLGWLTVIPPVIAIIMALISKEVVFSLLVGILSGTFILAKCNPCQMIIIAFQAMADKIGDNANILIFLGLVGILIVLVAKAGGSVAYGNWAAKKIKSQKGVLAATIALGCIVFIDDYFNCLTVGNVMRPVTDKHKISRVKLAYILDSIAAPVCILAPISSWGATISTYIQDSGISKNGMATFTDVIPYNLYSLLTIIMVVCVCVFDIKFKAMARFENDAIKNGVLSQVSKEMSSEQVNFKSNTKGKVCDLVVPILTMIIATLTMMVYTGGGFSGKTDFLNSFGKSNSSLSLVVGSFLAIVVALITYIPRKIITFKEFNESIAEGIKSMVSSFIILILAWTISEICSGSYLNTAGFIATVVKETSFPVFILPVVVFVVSSFLGFSTGTSWGTMAILIPVCSAICKTQDTAPFLYATLGAVLAGAVFGDHISPISDTTILSSAGAQCNHLDHVYTQITYSIVVSVSCLVGYLIMGGCSGPIIPFTVSLTLMLTTLFVLKKVKS